MREAAIEEARRLIAEALRVEPERITAETTMNGLRQWDSLAHMELIALVEEQVGTLSMDEILAITSTAALAGLLQDRSD